MLCCLLSLVAFAGPTAADDVKRDASKAVDTTGKFLSEKKDDFARRMQDKLDGIDSELKQLRASAEGKTKEAQHAIDERSHDLEKRRQDVAQQLEDLKKSSESTWKRLRRGVEHAVSDLQQAVTGSDKK